MEQSPCKLRVSQLVKIFPAFYGTRRFIIALSQINPVFAHPSYFLQILLPTLGPTKQALSRRFPRRLGLPSGLFPSGFPNKALYAPPFSPTRAVCPIHLILHLITQMIFGEEHRSLSFSLCSFLHTLVNWSFLGPNILLGTLFLYTLSLRSSLNVSDQVLHPYNTTLKIEEYIETVF
jgi:hypothetical protein